MMQDIGTALNGDLSKVPTLLSELRFWIMKRRCEKTLMHLPVSVKDYLPLLSLQDSPLASRYLSNKIVLNIKGILRTICPAIF